MGNTSGGTPLSPIKNPLSRLLSARTEDEIVQVGAEVLEETLGSPAAIFSLRSADRLEVRSTTVSSVDEAHRSFQLSDHVLDLTARLEDSARIDDCADTRSASAAQHTSGTYRSALLVPMANRGIMVVVADELSDAFDDGDLEQAELITRLLEAKLDAVTDESDLASEATTATDGDRTVGAGPSIADARLETIGSILSHDLSSPLTVARAYLDEAMDSGDLDDLEKVRLAIDRVDEITSGLEAFARTGRAVEERHDVELGVAAEDCWTLVDADAATLVTADTEVILADEQRLRQLLDNLFSNAVQHAGPDATVRVGTLDDRTGFFVEDDGPGIPEEERERVFEHGYSGSDQHSGFGLGIVRGIVEAHGWEIDVGESGSGGARFEVTGVRVADS